MGKLKQRIRHSGGDKYRVLLLDHEKHTEQFGTWLPSTTAVFGSETKSLVLFQCRSGVSDLSIIFGVQT